MWEVNSQVIGLLVSTGLTLILLFALYYFVIRKQQEGKAPTNRMMVFLELYYEGFRKLVRSLSGGAHEWSHLFLFTLFNFIFINSLTPWIGLEAAPTSLMFTLPLGLLFFIGIYIIGIGTMGLWGFIRHKYSNPMEIVMQFAPLISISVRLFGATFAGAVIGNVPWIVINGIAPADGFGWGDISTWAPVLQIFVMIFWKIADTALSLIQAFVFMTLTIIFWGLDTGPSWSAKERKRLKEEGLDGHSSSKKGKVESLELSEEQSENILKPIENSIEVQEIKGQIRQTDKLPIEEVQNE